MNRLVQRVVQRVAESAVVGAKTSQTPDKPVIDGQDHGSGY